MLRCLNYTLWNYNLFYQLYWLFRKNYNVLNHFVSELGQYKCSEKAKIFNLSLIFGTPFLIFYYLKIIPDSSRNIKVLFKWIISTIGLSAISIGIFSMDNTLIHVVSALLFFYLCFFSSLLFNIYFLFMKKQELPKHFLISGIFILGIFFIFLK